jgi:PAS domain S-box-containing protein
LKDQKVQHYHFFDIFIVDKKGNFIIHKDEKLSWTNYLKTDYNIYKEFGEISKDIISKDIFIKKTIGSKKLYLENKDSAFIIIKLSQELLEERIDKFYNIFLLLGIISFIVSTISAYFFSRPIINLTNEIKQNNKMLSEKIKEKTKELQKYLDIINKHILISTTDTKGVITFANEAFSKVCGYSVDELMNQPHSIIRHPDMPKSAFKDMWDTIQSGKTWRGKVKNRKKDGGYYWVDAVVSPNFDLNGEIDSYNAVRIDITDKMKLEELTEYQENEIKNQIKVANLERDKAKKLAKAKSEFLANMSHEIRTPLNAIVGFVDILQEKDIDKESLEYVNIIDKSSKSLLQIIEDILDFSKIESGKLNIDKIYFDPISEFKIIIDLFSGKSSKKNISLNVIIDKNLPKSINTDPLRVKQVISNLLSNSIKFTESGKNIFVTISYEKNLLHVSVKDEGKGIAKDKLKHIFEAFNQEDSSTTREFGGTGLGLSISSELVKLLGGELKVRSKINEGSEFYFSIPVTIDKEIKKDIQTNLDIDFSNIKLLLVEDNKSNQMFMNVILKKMKISFDIANDGVEAVEIFKKVHNQYDIILMDENMPNMNGIEATKQILKYEKEHNLKHTPIVALTANALKGDRERFLKAGMNEYLAKPLDKNKLKEILNKFI